MAMDTNKKDSSQMVDGKLKYVGRVPEQTPKEQTPKEQTATGKYGKNMSTVPPEFQQALVTQAEKGLSELSAERSTAGAPLLGRYIDKTQPEGQEKEVIMNGGKDNFGKLTPPGARVRDEREEYARGAR